MGFSSGFRYLMETSHVPQGCLYIWPRCLSSLCSQCRLIDVLRAWRTIRLWKSSFYACSQHFSPIQHPELIFTKKGEATVAFNSMLHSLFIFFFLTESDENFKTKKISPVCFPEILPVIRKIIQYLKNSKQLFSN